MDYVEVNDSTVTVVGPVGHTYHVLLVAGNVLVIQDCTNEEILKNLTNSLRLDRGSINPDFPSFEEELSDVADAEDLEMVLVELNADFGTVFKPDNGEPLSRRQRPTLVDIATIQGGNCIKFNENSNEVTVCVIES